MTYILRQLFSAVCLVPFTIKKQKKKSNKLQLFLPKFINIFCLFKSYWKIFFKTLQKYCRIFFFFLFTLVIHWHAHRCTHSRVHSGFDEEMSAGCPVSFLSVRETREHCVRLWKQPPIRTKPTLAASSSTPTLWATSPSLQPSLSVSLSLSFALFLSHSLLHSLSVLIPISVTTHDERHEISSIRIMSLQIQHQHTNVIANHVTHTIFASSRRATETITVLVTFSTYTLTNNNPSLSLQQHARGSGITNYRVSRSEVWTTNQPQIIIRA